MPRAKRETQGYPPMPTVAFHLPREAIDRLDQLVKEGYFATPSEAIRFAVFLLIYGPCFGWNRGQDAAEGDDIPPEKLVTPAR